MYFRMVQRLRWVRFPHPTDPVFAEARFQLGDDWNVLLTVHEIDRRLKVTNLAFEPRVDVAELTAGVTADLMRAFRLGDAQDDIRAQAGKMRRQLEESADRDRAQGDVTFELPGESQEQNSRDEQRAKALELAEDVRAREVMAEYLEAAMMKPSPGRRARRPESFFAAVALGYLGLQEKGVGRGIIPRLAESLADVNGGIRPTDQQVKSWVEGATRRNFLGKGTRGAAGRTRGARLEEFLRATEHDSQKGAK